MSSYQATPRVLYSFPHRLGKDRICTTAWYEIESAAAAGADMLVLTGDCVRPFTRPVRIRTTLSRGKIRIPYRLLGTMRACALHDWLVARQLPKLVDKVDIIHAWPLAALNTMKAAKKLGIPVALERCNTHTGYAYEVVQQECERLGIALPPEHEHAYKADVLAKEEKEYKLADRILCPSDFVAKTFFDYGFSESKLARHQYGYDPDVYYPKIQSKKIEGGLSALYVGGCAPRKGLHYALDAWLQSPACEDGKFLIAGAFIPGYAEFLSSKLNHPSVHVLGHRNDVPDLMRNSDVLLLPTIEEGSALVTYEARGCGCVLLVSEAAGAVCTHMKDALVHPVGDSIRLTQQITMLHENRQLLTELRKESLKTAQETTWLAAGEKLIAIYNDIVKNN